MIGQLLIEMELAHAIVGLSLILEEENNNSEEPVEEEEKITSMNIIIWIKRKYNETIRHIGIPH